MSFMKNSTLSNFDYKLYFSKFLFLLIPSIYKIIRLRLLSNLPDSYTFSIASNIWWLSLFYEVISEGLCLPLYNILGENFKDKEEFSKTARTTGWTILAVYLILAIMLNIFLHPLLDFMLKNKAIESMAENYIRLETIGLLLMSVFSFFSTLLLIVGKDRSFYILLIVQTILSIFLDFLFFGNLSFSLGLGVNGVAYSGIIVNLVLIAISFLLLKRTKTIITTNKYFDFSILKKWFRIGSFSALESFIRNLSFSIMIIKMVSQLSAQGTYWKANSFIWDVLLLPTMALAEIVKRESAVDKENVLKKKKTYFTFGTVLGLIYLVLALASKPFLKLAMNYDDYALVHRIVLIQAPAYISFIFNNAVMDSTLYGLGKTEYQLIQSLCIDVVYYSIMFILYKSGVFVPTLDSISIMFSMGMMLDLVPTVILYRKALKALRGN